MASPLWIAAQEGHALVVKELLASGATVDLARKVGAEVNKHELLRWRK